MSTKKNTMKKEKKITKIHDFILDFGPVQFKVIKDYFKKEEGWPRQSVSGYLKNLFERGEVVKSTSVVFGIPDMRGVYYAASNLATNTSEEEATQEAN